jgi:ABC-type histidine transport system ATPase subunit
MVRIDFKQLAKIEKQYAMNNQHVSLSTLQTMVDQILSINYDMMGTKIDVSGTIAFATLQELGILKEDNKTNVQQLNS